MDLDFLNNKKGQKGITLIALVITVIVLLILAGVTIAALNGDNGILTRAKEAKEKTEQAQKQEESDIKDLLDENMMDESIKKVTDLNPGILEQDKDSSNIYTINSIEDLVFFAYDVRNGNNYNGKTVKLGLTLDFESIKSYVDANRTDFGKYGYNGELKKLLTSGEGFIPIGSIEENNKVFYGIFDGNNYMIKNCYINKDAKSATSSYGIAFFAGILYGEVKNLGLVNINYSITNYNYAASITGIASNPKESSKISNCFVTGKIKQISYGTGDINCSGIATYNSGIIENCYNLVNIQGESTNNSAGCYLGGIVVNNENNYISNCYNKGQITFKGTGNVIDVGGIARISGNKDNSIKNSYNEGNIIVDVSKSSFLRVGGILGVCSNSCKTNIENVYNSGNLNVSDIDSKAVHLGGIVATYSDSSKELMIKNSYTIGAMKLNCNQDNFLVGAICGEDTYATTISNCYYLNTIQYNGVYKENSSIVNIDIKSISSSQKQELLSDLNKNGNNSWKNDDKNINNGYPILNWME